MTQDKETVVHLIPSTHWDREWYLPFRRFQVRLVRLMDKVQSLLDSGRYPFFLMDGQWIVLEDYLEIKPEERSRLEGMIRDGRLSFGPWYVVPDTLIPSGESLVRNLQIGRTFAEKFGGGLTVGYSPDSFGLAAQLPQIYAQFGFDAAMFTRGQRIAGDRRVEMRWQSPDGTVLPAIFGEYSYGLLLVLPTVWRNIDRLENTPDQAVRQAESLLAGDNARTGLPNRLWVVGVDHLEPKESLPELVEALNARVPGARFVLSTMREYFDAFIKDMQALPAPLSVGEQRGPYKEHFVLGNTLSSRMDIKKLNRRVENKLALTDGTLTALHSRGNTGYNRLDCPAIMKFAWRLLIQNHAHDSICCCSSDETMDDIEHRLRNALQLAREVEKESLSKLGATVSPGPSKGAVLVYNPLPFPRSGRVRARVAVPCALEQTRLVNADGSPVPGAAVERVFRKRRDIETLKTNEFAELEGDTTRIMLGGETETDVYTGLYVDFIAEDVPACGYRCYYFGEASAVRPQPDHPLESDYLRVDIREDGTLHITDKSSGRLLADTHYFEITPDDGDTYTFSPAGEAITTKGYPAEIEYLDCGALIRWELKTPRGSLHIRSKLSLADGGRTVAFSTKVENHAKNLRLRVVLDYPASAAFSMGDTAFDLTRRPVFDAAELEPANITTFPMREAAVLAMPWGREAVFSDGIHEYEAVNKGNSSSLALTILRATGKVYTTQTLTKCEIECGPGIRWWSENSQMQGAYHVHYALRSYNGDPGAAAILNDAAAFAQPLIPWGIYAEGKGPAAAEGCAVEGAVMTSMESGGSHIVLLRLHNPEDVPSRTVIRFASPVTEARLLNLAGGDEGLLPAEGNRIVFTLPPHKIATVKALIGQEESL